MPRTIKSATRPFASTRLVHFVGRRIGELKGFKSQAEIASAAGFPNRNMLSMIKTGDAKLPLDRVPALAKALECDPAMLFKLAVEQQDTALAGVIDEIFGTVVSQNEIGWLKELRDASDHTDPFLTTKAKRTLRALFGK
jgi:transcriptional regulator with XRE-family HTH domain